MAATTIDRGIAGDGPDRPANRAGEPLPPSTAVTELTLSARLRVQTASAHASIEARLGLPASIQTADDYTALLTGFLGIYQPLERLLTMFPDWTWSGVALPARDHGECLAADLVVLNVDPRAVPFAPLRLLPELPTFPHAVGALYVLEGATLGGQLILRDLTPRLGHAIFGATSFFGGRGALTGPLWRDFRAALDAFGREQPWHEAAVITGARRTFQAILAWFAVLQSAERQ